jgi:exopolysaccharide biosynthesis protein
MADLLISRGALHAINLDGGGSSTTVENGTTINRPTSSDNWAVKQERGVTTIACVV